MFKPRKYDDSVTEEERIILDKYAWMIRPCTVYIREYSDCTSIRGRFDQYYADGKLADCSRWRRDRADCREYMKEGNFKAGVRIIMNEKERVEDRIKSFKNNDVMKPREVRPPSNWIAPLPHHIEQKHEGSYLSNHLEELQEPLDSSSSCVIS